MNHYVSSILEKKPDLVIVHTGTNDLKPISLPEEITNEILERKRPPNCRFGNCSMRR